jgi:ketosteroid isomerase-like protein
LERLKRPLADRLELISPILTKALTRLTLAAPGPIRRAILTDAVERAEGAFNRGDLAVVFAAFDDDVDYQPPPPLPDSRRIRGRGAVLRYWQEIFRLFDQNRIENREIVEVSRGTIRRTARLHHRNAATGETLEYEILQTTEIRHGSVIRQHNELR